MVNFTGSACAGLAALAGLAIIVPYPAAGQSSAPSASTGTIKAMPNRMVTRPGTMPRRTTRNMHRNIDPKKMLPTGAGTRVVGPVDFHVPGGQTIAGPTSNPVPIVKHQTDSYLHIYGTIHYKGITLGEKGEPVYAGSPAFRTLDKQIRGNAPRECTIQYTGGQQKPDENHYGLTYKFTDTGKIGVCWAYFRNLKTLDVSAHAISFRRQPLQVKPDTIQTTDGMNRIVAVGPVIPATQSASK